VTDIADEKHTLSDHVCPVKDVGSFPEAMIKNNLGSDTLWAYAGRKAGNTIYAAEKSSLLSTDLLSSMIWMRI